MRYRYPLYLMSAVQNSSRHRMVAADSPGASCPGKLARTEPENPGGKLDLSVPVPNPLGHDGDTSQSCLDRPFRQISVSYDPLTVFPVFQRCATGEELLPFRFHEHSSGSRNSSVRRSETGAEIPGLLSSMPAFAPMAHPVLQKGWGSRRPSEYVIFP